MKYLWTEDRGAGLHFWQLVSQYFYAGKLIVESKGSNQGILDAVRILQPDDKMQRRITCLLTEDLIYGLTDMTKA